MPKFTGPSNANYNRGVIRTTETSVPTFEGGKGYVRNPRSELFLQAVAEMAENTYYENAEQRRLRLATNVGRVIAEPGGWEWVAKFVSWLRNEGNMRSAAIMVAAEAVANSPGNTTPSGRQLVSSACIRADEPAEFLGYWLQYHGRQIPASVKRGVADAATRLYTERNSLKYDGQSRDIRMADVIDLCHPVPGSAQQSALFKFLLDKRHNRAVDPGSVLPTISLDLSLIGMPESERVAAFEAGLTEQAGWAWERLGGWLPGGLSASAWEGQIPSMGYMALLRNLRNFDKAEISDAAQKAVAERIADPEQVAKSRQFPYRFLSAWKAIDSLHWGSPLETALKHSIQNIPAFEGRTLILVDTSGSMQSPVGGERSQAQRWEVAALFGGALAVRNANTDVAIYATGVKEIKAPSSSTSVLRFVEQMRSMIGSVGHGTNTWEAIRSQYANHDRVIVLTDEQSHDYGTNPGTWLHFINLAGYASATAPSDSRTFAYGGFTDAMFRTLPLLERGASGRWPWE